MKRWLQEFSFKKSFYERPNQKWVCGRQCEGPGCLAGPDARGQCPATAECRPLRKGDRWHCTRPPQGGGPCEAGPGPTGACACPIPKCQPMRSVRAWRGLTVLIVLGASLAVILFSLAAGLPHLSPGDLSFAHAAGGSQCSDCHASVGNRPADWLGNGLKTAAAPVDSQRCLECHNLGPNPLSPHAQTAAKLALITAGSATNHGAGRPPLGLQLVRRLVSPPGTELACATCHHEHQGVANNLRQLSNEQCQSCHARQFASLADGHPGFVNYPFERRTRLIFDHATHFQDHFPNFANQAQVPHTCLGCHQMDLKGSTMLVKGYEATCAACHAKSVKSLATTGIAWLSLPQVDTDNLNGAYAIGEWPADAADAGNDLTPFTRLLLAGEPALLPALEQVKNLRHLSPTDTNQLRLAQQIVWGIKGLIYDLGQSGQVEVIRRAEAGLGHALTVDQREGITAMLNASAIRNTFATSFPHLQSEIVAWRKAQKTDLTNNLVPSPGAPDQPDKPENWVSNGGWYTTDGSFTLFYRPSGHADRFLRHWLDLTAGTDQSPAPGAARAVFALLADPQKSVGHCAYCHSVEDQPLPTINWLGKQPESQRHAFEKFSHQTHLSLINNRGCFTCHPLKTGDLLKAYPVAFKPGQRNALLYSSSFQVINRQTCAECHQPGKVRDDCTLCHNYHVGKFKSVVPRVTVPLNNQSRTNIVSDRPLAD